MVKVKKLSDLILSLKKGPINIKEKSLVNFKNKTREVVKGSID
jgi:hypothetical protein